MKHLLSILLLTVTLAAHAKPDFAGGKRYHLECLMYENGCVTDGASAGQTTPLYYLTASSADDATYWEIDEVREGQYSIRNSLTRKYVTYDGVRSDSPVRRYVSMTATAADDRSLWTFSMQDGYYVIRNVSQSSHLWDVRAPSTGTPYVVGTYANSGVANLNQLFTITDESGIKAKEQVVIVNPLAEAAGTLRIDGIQPVFATDQNFFLCTTHLPFGSDGEAVVTYDLQDGWLPLTIDGTAVESGQAFRFEQILPGKSYSLSMQKADGSATITHQLTFTALPVVNIFGSFGYDYSNGFIRVQEPGTGTDELLDMKAKWRGGITNNPDKHKRNYHVKLLGADGLKTERRYFGLRNDNSWILESCQVDMSRIRNRMLTDLWNDFSVKPYYADQEPKAMTGTRGQFVELLLNGEYRGIYCMTEAMDRKQMKLAKYDEESQTMHGQLWKSKDWSYAVFMGHNSNSNYYPATAPVAFNNQSESWDQYYVKYPDIDDVKPTDWSVLYDAVKFVCTASDAQFKARVADYFDLPQLVDYYILMETILSTDNHGKNMYFACYDQAQDRRICFGVWDMDATTGQRWSDLYYHSTLMKPEQDYTTYIVNNEHGDYNLFRRMRMTDADDFNMRVRLRYRDLRARHLATDSLIARFERQLAVFKACGADQREYKKWSGDTDIERKTLNFDTEMTYLRSWITRRMNYLDNTRFVIGELPASGISPVMAAHEKVRQGIYNLSGQLVSSQCDEHVLRNLPSGIYIVNGRKVAVGSTTRP